MSSTGAAAATAAAATAAGAAPARVPAPATVSVGPVFAKHKHESTCDVVVLGAGLAGLTAANVLREQGLSCVVVEAAGYVGGRVKSHELLADFPVELGAEFVHGPTNALMRLVSKFGLETERIFTWAHGDGGPGPDAPVNGGCAYYWFGRTQQWVRFDADDAELRKFHEALWDIEELDVTQWKATDTIVDYLRAKGVNPRFFAMADAGYANTLCNTSSKLNITGAAKLFQSFSEDGEGELRILPSWQPLLKRMRDPLDVRTRWEVKKVEYTPCDADAKQAAAAAGAGAGAKACRVTSATGDVITCDRVVVCVPAPILRDQDIAFVPPLPAPKLESLRKINAEPCFKLALRFRHKFWPQDMHGCICADSVVPEWWSLPTHPHPTKGANGWDHYVLTGFSTSDYSRHLMALPRDEVLRQALGQLDVMFAHRYGNGPKPATAAFVDWATKDWGSDRFIKTGYTSCSFTSDERDRECIAAPVGGRLFFGGEHCAVGRCMVAQAAIETGEAAALDAVVAHKGLAKRPATAFVPPAPPAATAADGKQKGTVTAAGAVAAAAAAGAGAGTGAGAKAAVKFASKL